MIFEMLNFTFYAISKVSQMGATGDISVMMNDNRAHS